jgi:hypothetical protein
VRQPRFPVGSKVVRAVAGAPLDDLVVWTVTQYDAELGIYVAEGKIDSGWPAVRAFYEDEIRTAP